MYVCMRRLITWDDEGLVEDGAKDSVMGHGARWAIFGMGMHDAGVVIMCVFWVLALGMEGAVCVDATVRILNSVYCGLVHCTLLLYTIQ